LLGLTVIGRERETRKWLWWSKAWCHPKVLELRKEIAPKLRDFEKEGSLSIVETGKDVEELADIVCRLNDAQLLPEKLAIGVDPAGISAVLDELTVKERGISEDQIIAISQGWKLTGPIKNTERKLAAREIQHASQDLMAFCVSNARVEDKGNAILVTKAVSGKAKIDPLMAGYSAVSLMSLNPQGRKKKFQFFAIG
jgi:phage terminase large subunit-like protein